MTRILFLVLREGENLHCPLTSLNSLKDFLLSRLKMKTLFKSTLAGLYDYHSVLASSSQGAESKVYS